MSHEENITTINKETMYKEMVLPNKYAVLGITVIPFIIMIYAIYVGWASTLDLILCFVFFCPVGLGVTVGFHRLLTHTALKTTNWMKYLLAILGSASAEGPVLTWVADHRKHHRFTDVVGDPHSPHVNFEHNVIGTLKGLYFAHVGWLFSREMNNWDEYAKDLCYDRYMRLINRCNDLIIVLGLLIPAITGGLITMSWGGFYSALVWGGFVRIVLLHHITYSINSLCHVFGSRTYNTQDHSTNVFWLCIISMGESWHNNHHAFPRSARQGLTFWQLDPSYYFICILEFLGLAWDVNRPSISSVKKTE